MVVIQFGKHLLHYRFTVKHRPCAYTESLAITVYGSDLTVIQIDDLSMPAHKRSLLFLQIFRIHMS